VGTLGLLKPAQLVPVSKMFKAYEPGHLQVHPLALCAVLVTTQTAGAGVVAVGG
jgi:hypothetical protein